MQNLNVNKNWNILDYQTLFMNTKSWFEKNSSQNIYIFFLQLPIKQKNIYGERN